MAVNELKTIDEFKKAISDKKLTLVDFYADWCGPCKMIAPIINDLAKTYSDVNFIKVNVDVLQDFAQNYGILWIPTLVTFQNAKEVKRIVGFSTADKIKKDLLS